MKRKNERKKEKKKSQTQKSLFLSLFLVLFSFVFLRRPREQERDRESALSRKATTPSCRRTRARAGRTAGEVREKKSTTTTKKAHHRIDDDSDDFFQRLLLVRGGRGPLSVAFSAFVGRGGRTLRDPRGVSIGEIAIDGGWRRP